MAHHQLAQNQITNYLSIDAEDYFQVAALKEVVGRILKELGFTRDSSIFPGRKIPVAGGGYFRLSPTGLPECCLKKSTSRKRSPSFSTFTPL